MVSSPVLPARNRLTRSSDFGLTVGRGARAAQPDMVVHLLRSTDADGPKVGLVVGKSVGNAVERHRVARKLRHVARRVLGELDAGDQLVIRALPSSRKAISARLEEELRAALRRSQERGRVSR